MSAVYKRINHSFRHYSIHTEIVILTTSFETAMHMSMSMNDKQFI